MDIVSSTICTLALLTIIAACIVFFVMFRKFHKQYNTGINNITGQINVSQSHASEYDKQHILRTNTIEQSTDVIQKSYVSKNALQSGVNTERASVVAGSIDDAVVQKTVMANNIYAGEELSVGNNAKITRNGIVYGGGMVNAQDVKGRSTIKTKDDTAWMRNGNIYASSTIASKNILAKDMISTNGNAAFLKSDGSIYARSGIDTPNVIGKESVRTVGNSAGMRNDGLVYGSTFEATDNIRTGRSVMRNDGTLWGQRVCVNNSCMTKPDLLQIKQMNKPRSCVVSGWSEWEPCSKLCGGGVQRRYRNVVVAPTQSGAACPVLSETQTCNTQACMFNASAKGVNYYASK
jgi:hypothetical protein